MKTNQHPSSHHVANRLSSHPTHCAGSAHPGVPNGSSGLNSQLQLAVKEYRPRDNLHASDGAVTIIAAHANGIPKECYEALWDDLYHELKNKHAIRAIWIADTSNQGASGILYENVQGDDRECYFA